MRLRRQIIDKIHRAAENSFENASIYLFGSRSDGGKIGGDIDIAIDAKGITKSQFRKNKIKLLANLVREGFDLKIDIVDYNTSDALLSKCIKQEGCFLFAV